MENKNIAIGVDIGGTSIKGAAITKEGKVLDVFTLDVHRGDSQEKTIREFIDLLKKYLTKHNYSN